MEPDNLALDRYILAQCETTRPKVCFLPTASGDAEGYQLRFYKAMAELDAQASVLSLFRPHTADMEGFLLDQDVIYVGGGNTKNMLALWSLWGLDEILRRAWQAGVILTGLSAGAICWFEEGLTDSNPGTLSALPCLGFLPGSCAPHYDGEAQRRPRFTELIQSGQMSPGLGIDDGCAIHFIGTAQHAIVSSRPNATAYEVCVQDNETVERPLKSQLLKI